MRAAQKRGEKLGLSNNELAYYDALEVNDSAVNVLGDETLRTIARELVDTVEERDHRLDREGIGACQAPRYREAHPAQVRLPAGQAGSATDTVLEQAKLLSGFWTEGGTT